MKVVLCAVRVESDIGVIRRCVLTSLTVVMSIINEWLQSAGEGSPWLGMHVVGRTVVTRSPLVLVT